jgi:hypothetical protein
MGYSNFKSEPIIIGGCGRSGTTLLLAILGAHPHIYAIPEETQVFCPGAYAYKKEATNNNKPGKGLSREQLFRLRLENLNTDKAIEIKAIQPFLDRARKNYNRWCEKTPKNVLFFKGILKAFNEKVKLIHMVRDGRDVVTSTHPGRTGYHIPIDRWITEVSAGLALKDHSCVYMLKYEDLVLRFDMEIEKLCRFLGEPEHPNLCKWYEHTNISQHDGFHNERAAQVYSHAVGRWKNNRFKSRIHEFMCNEEALFCLQVLGYE